MCDVNVVASTAGVLFLIGFVGDIFTQFFAKFINPHGSAALYNDFWSKYGRLGAAATAGLITLLFGGMMFILALALYEYGLRLNSKDQGWTFILFATAIGFLFGVLLDILANRGNWDPSMKKWYDGMGESGAAMWSGGLTFALVLFITAVWWRYTK